jgi:hypothetical protein
MVTLDLARAICSQNQLFNPAVQYSSAWGAYLLLLLQAPDMRN